MRWRAFVARSCSSARFVVMLDRRIGKNGGNNHLIAINVVVPKLYVGPTSFIVVICMN